MEQQRDKRGYIHERWQQLNSLVISTVDAGLRYLFAVSGGGCIAVLTFIGTDTNANIVWLGITLALFFIALVLVGLLNILRFWHINRLLETWRENSSKLFANKITQQAMMIEDEKLVRQADWLVNLAYASFVSIILAGLAGFTSFIVQ